MKLILEGNYRSTDVIRYTAEMSNNYTSESFTEEEYELLNKYDEVWVEMYEVDEYTHEMVLSAPRDKVAA